MKKLIMTFATLLGGGGILLSAETPAQPPQDKDWYWLATTAWSGNSNPGTALWKLNNEGKLVGIPDYANLCIMNGIHLGFYTEPPLGDVYINSEGTVGYNDAKAGKFPAMGTLWKYGSGSFSSGVWRPAGTGNMYFYDGKIALSAAFEFPNFSSLGDPFVPHDVYFYTTNTVGFGSLAPITNTPRIKVFLDGTKLNFGRDGTRVFGELVMTNGVSMYLEGGMKIYFNGDISVKGEGKSAISWWGKPSGWLNAGSGEPVVIDVDDVAEGDDFTFNIPLYDYVLEDHVWTRSPWIKKGSGTMVIPSNAGGSYTGDIKIFGGTVRIDSCMASGQTGAFGNPNADKTNIVCDATLELNGHCLLANPWSFPARMVTIVSNATLDCSREQIHSLGNMRFYNATILTATKGTYAGIDGKTVEGCLFAGGLLEFDGDNGSPYMITNYISNGQRSYLRLGCLDRHHEEYVTNYTDGVMTSVTTNHFGNTEFRVAEITKDGRPDVVFSTEFYNWYSTGRFTYSCGLRKTGSGILSLTKGNNWSNESSPQYHSYTGGTTVDEGGFLLPTQGGGVQNGVVVNAGGAIGGNGRIGGGLVINAGGGFLVDAKSVVNKLYVPEGVTLPGTDEGGTLLVYNYAGNLDEFELTGIDPFPSSVTAEQKAAIAEAVAAGRWSARVHGYTAKKCTAIEVTMTNGKFNLKYKQSGFVIIVR